MANLWKTADDVLDYAVTVEEQAITVFTQMAEEAESEDTRSLLLKFSAEEVDHKKKLLSMKENASLSSAALDLQAMEEVVKPAKKELVEMDPAEALAFAIGCERDMKLLYDTLAEMVNDEGPANTFRGLAADEAVHVREFMAIAAN
jgi:rubrerythrin